MKNKEVIEQLNVIDDAIREDIFGDNTWEQDCELRKALQHAIKCVELMPEAIEWIETLKEYSDSDCEELIEFLEKAKELIE